MLPAAYRLRRRVDFAAVVRHGRRAGRARVVVHVLAPSHPDGHASGDNAPIAGFVVSRAVGGAVQRNRARRQLRHLMARRLGTLPPGCRLVVRALPAAAGASSTELGADLDAALARALRSPSRPGAGRVASEGTR